MILAASYKRAVLRSALDGRETQKCTHRFFQHLNKLIDLKQWHPFISCYHNQIKSYHSCHPLYSLYHPNFQLDLNGISCIGKSKNLSSLKNLGFPGKWTIPICWYAVWSYCCVIKHWRQ